PSRPRTVMATSGPTGSIRTVSGACCTSSAPAPRIAGNRAATSLGVGHSPDPPTVNGIGAGSGVLETGRGAPPPSRPPPPAPHARGQAAMASDGQTTSHVQPATMIDLRDGFASAPLSSPDLVPIRPIPIMIARGLGTAGTRAAPQPGLTRRAAGERAG